MRKRNFVSTLINLFHRLAFKRLVVVAHTHIFPLFRMLKKLLVASSSSRSFLDRRLVLRFFVNIIYKVFSFFCSPFELFALMTAPIIFLTFIATVSFSGKQLTLLVSIKKEEKRFIKNCHLK